jgi:soluble lytic murein transglycosylase-like protein
MRHALAACAAAALLCALPLRAGTVQVKVREDGRKVIVNETRAQHDTRLASTLVPVANNLAALIEEHADRVGLDPRLVRAVIQVESGYDPQALSNKGAMGLMQLTAETAHDYSVDDPYDPEQNLRGGTAYLKALIDHFSGSIDLALAGYNAGPGTVEKYAGIPPYAETTDYVEQVLGLYNGTLPLRDTSTMTFAARKVQLGRDAKNRILLTNTGRHQ